MMIHPDGVAVFIEIPKTGSTSATHYLNKKAKWFQNGAKGTSPIPGTFPGRHSHPNEESRALFDEHGVTVYCVVRNPWDRMASMWRASAPGSTSFIDYLKTGKFKHGPYDLMTKPQLDWAKWADHVIRYEELERTWEQMAFQFGHLPNGPLPKINVSKNRAVPQWTREELDIIEKRFIDDIEKFGYTGPGEA